MEDLIKIHCKLCEQTFSVIIYPSLEFNYGGEPESVAVGYHGRFGIGEEGVWFCPLCGEGGDHTSYSSLEEIYDNDDEDKEEDEPV